MKLWKLIGVLLLGAVCYADSTTSRIGLTVPAVGSSGWATKINNDLNVIDSSVAVLSGANTFTGSNIFDGTVWFPNLTPGQCLQLDSNNQVTSQSCITPPGSDTQVIYNQGGTFAGSSNFTFNNTTMSVTGISASTMTITRIVWPDGTVQVTSPTVTTGPPGAAGTTVYPASATASFPFGSSFSTATISTVSVNSLTDRSGTAVLTTNPGNYLYISSITFGDGTVITSTNNLTVSGANAILNQSTLQAGATFYVPFGTLTKLVVTSTFSVTGDSITLGGPSSQIAIPTLGAGPSYVQVTPSGLLTASPLSSSVLISTSSLQTGATFYVSSGTVSGQLFVNTIRWPDGTIQISSPIAGASGSFINNTSTLQSGATFYVSSGTVRDASVLNSFVLRSTTTPNVLTMYNPPLPINGGFGPQQTPTVLDFVSVSQDGSSSTGFNLNVSTENIQARHSQSSLSMLPPVSNPYGTFNINLSTGFAGIYTFSNQYLQMPDNTPLRFNNNAGTGDLTYLEPLSNGLVIHTVGNTSIARNVVSFSTASAGLSIVSISTQGVTTVSGQGGISVTYGITAATGTFQSIRWPDGTIQVSSPTGGGAGIPGGVNTQLQYNSAGSFAGTNFATVDTSSISFNSISSMTFVGFATMTFQTGTALDVSASTTNLGITLLNGAPGTNGQVLTSGGPGTIPSWAAASSFTPQAFQTTLVSISSTTSSTYATSPLTKSATLQNSSYKWRITLSLAGYYSNNASNTAIIVTIFRDSSDLATATQGFCKNAAAVSQPCSVTFYDSPGDTSSHTYQVRFKNQDNATGVNLNEGSTQQAELLLEEVKQ